MLLGALVHNFTRNGTPSWQRQKEDFLHGAKFAGVKLSVFDNVEALRRIASAEEPFDFVYLDDYDPYLAYALSSMGVRVFNGPKSMEITHDLALFYLHLAAYDVPHPSFYASTDTAGTSLVPHFDMVQGGIKAKGLAYPYFVRARYGEQDVRPSLLLTDLELNAFLKSQRGLPFLAEEYLPGDALIAYVIDSECRLVLGRRPSGDQGKRSELLFKTKLDNALTRRIAERACEAIGLPFAMVFLVMKGNEPVVVGASPCIRTVAPSSLTGIDLAASLFECFKKCRRKQPLYATRKEIRRFEKLAKAPEKLAKKK